MNKDTAINQLVYTHFGANKVGKVYSWNIYAWGIQISCENGTVNIYFSQNDVFFQPLEG